MCINKNEKSINDKPGDCYRQFGWLVIWPFIFGMLFGIFVAIIADHS